MDRSALEVAAATAMRFGHHLERRCADADLGLQLEHDRRDLRRSAEAIDGSPRVSRTRKKAPHWKSGFYSIARGAGVPIVLGYLDYERKIAGLGPALTPTGDLAADFAVFRDFYAAIKARYPELVGPVLPPPR